MIDGASYGFAMKTVINEARARIAALEREINQLRAEFIEEIRSK